MPLEKTEIYTHLGDGVYAKYDGFGIWLLANDHLNPTDRVYLEPQVYTALLNWVKYLKKTKNNIRK